MPTRPDPRASLYHRIRALELATENTLYNPPGSVVVARSTFKRFEGEGQALPYAALVLCLGGGGETYREHDTFRFKDVWQPGKVGLALPGPAAKGYAPEMEALLIAFELDAIPACHGRTLGSTDLHAVQSQLYDDKLAASVMQTLFRDAETHGSSSVFFEHGLSLVLHRLAMLAALEPHKHAMEPMPSDALTPVLDVIDARLEEDLTIKDLATLLGLKPRTFSRLFKRETGSTPYRYLTNQRMERAKRLLRDNASVTDTASAVGYANPAKFAAAFRRWIGMSPSAWKKLQ